MCVFVCVRFSKGLGKIMTSVGCSMSSEIYSDNSRCNGFTRLLDMIAKY